MNKQAGQGSEDCRNQDKVEAGAALVFQAEGAVMQNPGLRTDLVVLEEG